ncbi:uncharacterized protein LOC132042736 [Lycium ferocissimum]|uniref:uncharacterized protein LOC132042736 n=1 Tax=Lycium ferocissimum TaxID=112874 RepID=UPI0028157604|nr:uncharacterized protein LOC132042736 [Lycium ferocissimum]
MITDGPRINHLAYADDIILFTSWDNYSLKTIMRQLRKYEEVSGQKINKAKSMFLTASHAASGTISRVKRITGFQEGNFPFTYLGCPIYTGRKRISHYAEISSKIVKRIAGWQGNLLSPGGKAVIIQQVLQSQTIHILATVSPPKIMLKQLEKYFANFFLGQSEGKNKYHWGGWKNLCYPKDEEGLGFKSLTDIQSSFIIKRWWRFRTQKSLWADYLKAKYCIRVNSVARNWSSGQSQSWKELLACREIVEPHMLWKINSGTSLFIGQDLGL